MYLADYLAIFKRRQLLYIPIYFGAHKVPYEEGSTLKENMRWLCNQILSSSSRPFQKWGKTIWKVASFKCNPIITKTRLYNFDPLKPHFYIVKLGFTGVYIIFLISAQNTDCMYSLEPPRRGGSNEYLQSMFWAEIRKISEFFIWKFSFFWW